MPPDPFDTVTPVGRAPRRAAAPPEPPVTLAPKSEKPHLLDARLEGLEAPATVPEIIGMMSTLARQFYEEATDTDRKSYEREHLGRTFASLADKLSDLLAKPALPPPDTADDLRAATHDLAAKLARVAPSANGARPAS